MRFPPIPIIRFADRSSAFHKEEAMTTLEQMRDAWDKFASGYDEAITPLAHLPTDWMKESGGLR